MSNNLKNTLKTLQRLRGPAESGAKALAALVGLGGLAYAGTNAIYSGEHLRMLVARGAICSVDAAPAQVPCAAQGVRAASA